MATTSPLPRLFVAVAAMLAVPACRSDRSAVESTNTEWESFVSAATVVPTEPEAVSRTPLRSTSTAPRPAATTTQPPAGSIVLEITDSQVEIDVVRVPAGTVVAWENTDSFAHTVTAVDSSPQVFASASLNRGERFSWRFDQPGVYRYFCEHHPERSAIVIVE